MPFRPTLVALGEDAAEYPYLGFHVLEIPIMEPNDSNAGIPRVQGFESRDKFTEGVTGADTKVARRKLGELEMTIDYVDADKKAEIERLILDDRTVYFCPNMGPDTLWSFPLQRSLADFTGNKTMVNTRASKAYLWDPVDKVFRSFDDDAPQFGFRGAWSRFLRTQTGSANATSDHPNSTLISWFVVGGTGTFTYTESMQTPVLSFRDTVGTKGVLFFEGDQGTTVSINKTSGAISSTKSVVASVCVAWTGQIVVALQNLAGSTTYDTVSVVGDGTLQLIKLGGLNSDASTAAQIVIVLVETPDRDQSLILGPTFIGNGSDNTEDPPRIIDWSEFGVPSNHDVIASTDSVENIFTEGTVTWFGQWASNRVAFCRIGSATKSIYIGISGDTLVFSFIGGGSRNFSTMASEFGVVEGGWYHFAVAMGEDGGVSLFVNGEPHSANGVTFFESGYFDDIVRIGQDLDRRLDDSGMSHLRLDRREWTEQEVKDHYATYFKGAGRGVVEPLFGKELVIETVDWVPMTVSQQNTGDVHWRGTAILRELGPTDGLAGLVRQEGSV